MQWVFWMSVITSPAFQMHCWKWAWNWSTWARWIIQSKIVTEFLVSLYILFEAYIVLNVHRNDRRWRDVQRRTKCHLFCAFSVVSFCCVARLTAFVLRTFVKAQSFVYIAPNVIQESKNWLDSLQSKDGCFQKVGSLFNNRLKVSTIFCKLVWLNM